MAEFVFRDMLSKRGLSEKFVVNSSATSTEEIGNPPHRGTVELLNKKGIPVFSHRSVRLRKSDYDNYDYFIGMDTHNIANMHNILRSDADGKIFRLLDFTDNPHDVADPWYSGDFETCYNDIAEGCAAFLEKRVESKE
ncbi:phosphotyrosine protein phosphatase [Fibrobacterales bacterium]|nr:phosphotyrosine protein phosphatase [Fibrobacterales bacterium]